MDYTAPPSTPEEITGFLERSLKILREIHSCKMTQDGLSRLFEYLVSGMDADEETQLCLQKKMIPEVIHADAVIRELLQSPDGQYMLNCLPLRYCNVNVLLWLIVRHRKRPFPDLRAAFRAADIPFWRVFYLLREDSWCRRIRRRVHDALEAWLEDHPASPFYS